MAQVSGKGTEEERMGRKDRAGEVEGAVEQEREEAEGATGAEGGHSVVQHCKLLIALDLLLFPWIELPHKDPCNAMLPG